MFLFIYLFLFASQGRVSDVLKYLILLGNWTICVITRSNEIPKKDMVDY